MEQQPQERREKARRRTAEEIVDAAEQLVLREDLEALTVQRVAAGIGMTAGALYRYFPSRDAIVAAVQRRVIEALARALDEAVARAHGTEPELRRILALTDGVLAFARQEPVRYGLLARMLAIPRPLVGDGEAQEVLPVALGALERARSLLESARVAGALGPGDDTRRVLALWAAVHGAIQLHKLARFDPAAGEIGAEAVDALLIGFGAAPERVRAARRSS